MCRSIHEFISMLSVGVQVMSTINNNYLASTSLALLQELGISVPEDSKKKCMSVLDLLPVSATMSDGYALTPQGTTSLGNGKTGIPFQTLLLVAKLLKQKGNVAGIPEVGNKPNAASTRNIENYFFSILGSNPALWAIRLAKDYLGCTDDFKYSMGSEQDSLEKCGGIPLKDMYMTFQPVITNDIKSGWLTDSDMQRCLHVYLSLVDSIAQLYVVASSGITVKKFNTHKQRIVAVFNVDPGLPGTHWIAMAADRSTGKVWYYDPLGQPFQPNSAVSKRFDEFKHALQTNLMDKTAQVQVWTNTQSHQKDYWNCGVYALLFCILASRDNVSEDYLEHLPLCDDTKPLCSKLRVTFFNKNDAAPSNA